MILNRRDIIKGASCGCVAMSLFDIFNGVVQEAAAAESRGRPDQMTLLPPDGIRFNGYLEEYIERSLANWSKGVVPYKALAGFFRAGRPKITAEGRSIELFATGEMWGKAVRSAALFYRYTGDPELKGILKATVADLLSTRRANGSISCSPVDRQPDGPGGDLWERTYVLLALDEYYEWVERDPAVLQAMVDEADVTLQQVGPPPKVRIVDLGWSANHIESSTILEPIVRLYKRTGDPRYLQFARYIVEEEGGAKNHNIFSEVLGDADPVDVGGIYPKGYEMLSLFEGLVEYYRATGNERWRQASMKLFHKVIEKEITLIGNGGGDQPYHPNVMGEAWDNTALEQTNPDIHRMMETCTGVTWLKFCHQILRLTANPAAADYIELYTYNGLIGAMKPAGDGFSYVNLLNGIKTNRQGWGTDIEGVYVTCCNLNGPEGLAYLPLVAVMSDAEGPVVNLYNACTANIPLSGADSARLKIVTDYPLNGGIRIEVIPTVVRRFIVKLRIPSWSRSTTLAVNGAAVEVQPGSYARIERKWSPGDTILLGLDMRCRLVKAPHGFHEGSDRFRALVRGPVVLARDENIDARFADPVDIIETDGIVAVKATKPTLPGTKMQFEVPTRSGPIKMVDYASVNSWEGKRIQTWLPTASHV
jgi:uncharacterized protein